MRSSQTDAEINPGEKFKALRNHARMTQPEFSKETGIPLGTVKSIETGKHAPGFTVLQKLAEHSAFRSSIFWLVSNQRDDIRDPVRRIDPVMPHGEDGYIYRDLLSAIIEAIENVLDETKRAITPQKKAELISLLYAQTLRNSDSYAEAKHDVSLSDVYSLIELAT